MRVAHLMMAASIHVPSQYAIKESFQIAPSVNYYNELSSTLQNNRDRLSRAFQDVGLSNLSLYSFIVVIY